MKKIKFLITVILSFAGLLNLSAQEQTSKQIFIGSWMGRLEISAVTLRVIFNLSATGNDSISATLDSPDQGAKSIKVGPVTVNGMEIKIMAPLLMAEYSGTMKNDTLIEGTFKQAGMTLPLNLIKLEKPFTMNRPQEPKPPFPYKSEDVKFTNTKAGIDLAGTITLPEGDGPFPAVILISGSGSQNRNEELLGHKPFLVIADYLTRKGIAVLRYDDRGVGQSQGSPLNATSADFAVDAEAAFLYLLTRKDIRQDRIGLAGHSEGGLIASIVASGNQKVGFVISLAGTGVNGEEILNRQNMDISLLSGIYKKQVKESISINKKIFAVLKKETDNKKAESEITNLYREFLGKKKSSPEETDKAVRQLNASMNPVSYNWMRYFLVTNPADYWKKVRCPVLALNGEKDLQVAADINLPAIEKALRKGGNNSVRTVRLHALNHLFQHCKTGLPSEYPDIEETFSPEVLAMIDSWIKGL